VWGCGTNATSPSISGGNLEFSNVSNPQTLSLGESITFSVIYRNEVLKITACKVRDTNGDEVLDNTYGTTTHTDTTCTYTAPCEMPRRCSDSISGSGDMTTEYFVDVTLDTNPNATARLRVKLTGPVPESCECRDYKDCKEDEACIFGSCVPYDELGIDLSRECINGSDCNVGDEDQYTCVRLAGEGCNGYCASNEKLVVLLLGDSVPKTEEECSKYAESGAVWWVFSEEDHAPVDAMCIPGDIASCFTEGMAGGTGSGV